MKLGPILIAAALLAAPSLATAEPFDPAQVPADAAWVVHVDVDALARGRLWPLAEANLARNPKYVERLAEIERLGAVKLPEDLHGVLLFSSDIEGRDNAVIVIDSDAKPERLTTLVAMNPTYSMESLTGGGQVHSWKDAKNDRTVYASFLSEHRLALSSSRAQLDQAITLAAGKSEPIKTDAPMFGHAIEMMTPPATASAATTAATTVATEAASTGPMKTILFAASADVAALAKARRANARILDRIGPAWMTLNESADAAVVTGDITAINWRSAQALKVSLNSASSMISLFVPESNPNAALIGEALETVEATSTGETVSVHWPIPFEKIVAEMQKRGLEVPAKQ